MEIEHLFPVFDESWFVGFGIDQGNSGESGHSKDVHLREVIAPDRTRSVKDIENSGGSNQASDELAIVSETGFAREFGTKVFEKRFAGKIRSCSLPNPIGDGFGVLKPGSVCQTE
ncbi:MAG: hypothetical protein BWY82_02651 [Verrucomicrobia bacterium ADurb.Bin474]|nr:MAG: hypothetical protein BWY82_02651 [Verrucomicrobia bacterium ADurb.Bin474]